MPIYVCHFFGLFEFVGCSGSLLGMRFAYGLGSVVFSHTDPLVAAGVLAGKPFGT